LFRGEDALLVDAARDGIQLAALTDSSWCSRPQHKLCGLRFLCSQCRPIGRLTQKVTTEQTRHCFRCARISAIRSHVFFRWRQNGSLSQRNVNFNALMNTFVWFLT